ncbi:proline racemase [Brevundimonas diminuta]|jgi:proline racemase|uniref:proline racemase family protein n=1 Tax=Brevundimonas TaxID=41275 RepID=UPI000207F246|nr:MULTISPECIES: proline racemase family protein [Brevundimonas]EGF94793.1 proline racemase [Brevundimonas diminuta ATCC 11568]MDM8351458.1 proline racemase family protein [Brevundimonas diminuta]OMG60752.1 proline racemase [Brevundimonas sp. ZS04]OWR24563.1 proline racemase [Brevundimonas diminuta]WQE46428.1 proline racemase family protein [Brevundimonas diminuta]
MNAPTEAVTLRTLDMHTAGEPVRIVEAGYPELVGATLLEKRRDAHRNHDHLRRALMLEPRGHADMYGVIPTSACHPDADFAALFTHQEGYSTMCGHATLALGRWAVDSGRVRIGDDRARFKLEAPCGVVDVEVWKDAEEVRVAFESVEAYCPELDQAVEVPGFGSVQLDIAFGGAFYAVLPASRLGLSLMDTPLAELAAAAVAITDAVRATLPVRHPSEPDLGFLYGTILTDDTPLGDHGGLPSYNLCVFAEGQIDRSPTGSGVTARIALCAARGEMQPGQSCEIRGVSGQGFTGTLARVSEDERGIVSRVRVEGTSHYIGRSEFVCEPSDPFAWGFELPVKLNALSR